jgi:hypothetical protein
MTLLAVEIEVEGAAALFIKYWGKWHREMSRHQSCVGWGEACMSCFSACS